MTGVKITKDIVANIITNIEAIPGKHVLIGIPDESNERNDGQVTNAYLGYIHENGAPAQNIPARPFLVPGVTEAGPKAAEKMKRYAGKALDDPDALDKALNAAGLIAQNYVKRHIRNQIGFAALAPKTLAQRRAKGMKGSKALIVTGQLLNSITYVIREK